MSTAKAKAVFSRIAATLVATMNTDSPDPSRLASPAAGELAASGLLLSPPPGNTFAELEKLGLVAGKRQAVRPPRPVM